MGDESTIGCTGIVVVPTRGPAGPGEVLLSHRGGTEGYLAWSDEPLDKGARVIVTGVRAAARTVEIALTEGPTHNPES